MARPANLKETTALQEAVSANPGQKPSFFARLLQWTYEKVERTAANTEKTDQLLWEDEKGRLFIFNKRKTE